MPNPTRKALRARILTVKEEIATLTARLAVLKDERRTVMAELRAAGPDTDPKPVANKPKTTGKTPRVVAPADEE